MKCVLLQGIKLGGFMHCVLGINIPFKYKA